MLHTGLVSAVDSLVEEQVRFLIDLCDRNSYTYNKEGTDTVAGMILDRLNGILPEHRIFEQGETGNHHRLQTRSGGGAIVLVGHLDTVFPPDQPFQKCSLSGDALHGPGTADMKGGLAVFVYALKALDAAGLLDGMSIVLLLTGDEEIGSPSSHRLFEEERKGAAACLTGECAGPGGEVVVSRNGKTGARIDCFGRGRHVGAGTHEKSSAVLELAHKIVATESLNASLPGVSVNVGTVQGGLGPSTVPGHASSLLDIRWEQEEHRALLLEKVRAIISRPHQPGCRSELTLLNARPAMPFHEGTEKLFRTLQETGARLGLAVQGEHRRGTSDANFFGSAGVPTLDGFGPVGGRDHTPGELIFVPSLRARTVLLAHFLLDLHGRESAGRPEQGGDSTR
jgi:glutamate carboxypeptidase